MRGFIVALSGSGGAGRLPARSPGDGKRGASSFSGSRSGAVSFKSSAAGALGPAGQGPAIFKAAYTCAGLGVVGDGIAQTITRRGTKAPYDAPRTARQCAYNFAFYGPLQHFWYAALARAFPAAAGAGLAANFAPFAWKVFLNQAVLGPVVVATFFAWSMALTGQREQYGAKMRSDAFPTLRRGWAFWVPAASVNFAVVPLRFQVLYMSCCSIVWNYILSTAAARK